MEAICGGQGSSRCRASRCTGSSSRSMAASGSRWRRGSGTGWKWSPARCWGPGAGSARAAAPRGQRHPAGRHHVGVLHEARARHSGPSFLNNPTAGPTETISRRSAGYGRSMARRVVTGACGSSQAANSLGWRMAGVRSWIRVDEFVGLGGDQAAGGQSTCAVRPVVPDAGDVERAGDGDVSTPATLCIFLTNVRMMSLYRPSISAKGSSRRQSSAKVLPRQTLEMPGEMRKTNEKGGGYSSPPLKFLNRGSRVRIAPGALIYGEPVS
jgi:hypothetical protein